MSEFEPFDPEKAGRDVNESQEFRTANDDAQTKEAEIATAAATGQMAAIEEFETSAKTAAEVGIKAVGVDAPDAKDYVENMTSISNGASNYTDAVNRGKVYETSNPTAARISQLFLDSAKIVSNSTNLVESDAERKASNGIQDALSKGDAQVENAVKIYLETPVDPSTADKLAENGGSKWDLAYKFLRLLAILGSVVGLIFLICKLLTGCYKFKVDKDGNVDKNGPLSCPVSKDSQLCTCLKNDGTNVEKCDDASDGKKPMCCSGGGGEICTGVPGASPSLYYQYVVVTPGSLLKDGLDGLNNLLNQAGKGVAEFLKYILYGLAGVAGIVVLYFVIRLVISLTSKRTQTQKSSRPRNTR